MRSRVCVPFMLVCHVVSLCSMPSLFPLSCNHCPRRYGSSSCAPYVVSSFLDEALLQELSTEEVLLVAYALDVGSATRALRTLFSFPLVLNQSTRRCRPVCCPPSSASLALLRQHLKGVLALEGVSDPKRTLVQSAITTCAGGCGDRASCRILLSGPTG